MQKMVFQTYIRLWDTMPKCERIIAKTKELFPDSKVSATESLFEEGPTLVLIVNTNLF